MERTTARIKSLLSGPKNRNYNFTDGTRDRPGKTMNVMEKRKTERNAWFGIYKWMLAFCVCCLHFIWDTGDIHPTAFFRIAVPSFGMLSGYFLFAGEGKSQEDAAEKAKKFMVSSIAYCLVGIVFAIAVEMVMALINGQNMAALFSGYFKEGFLYEFLIYNKPFTSTYGYHLWYLIGLAFASVIVFVLFRLKAQKALFFLPLLFLVQLFFSNWVRLLPGQYDTVSYYLTRNAYFMVLPSVSMGWVLAHLKNLKFRWWLTLACFVVGAILFAMQFPAANAMGNRETFVCSIIASAAFILGLAHLPPLVLKKWETVVGKYGPYFVYVVHVFVGKLLWHTPGIYIPIVPYLTFIVTAAIYLLMHWAFGFGKRLVVKLKERRTVQLCQK